MLIGVFESATQIEATRVLMRAGAQYVMTMDGGDSTSLYLGGRARGVPNGLRFGGQRPVATVIGIKADPILDHI
jgi:exopolysaccharide biosynthesis protein